MRPALYASKLTSLGTEPAANRRFVIKLALPSLVDDFVGVDVIVIGDCILDVYLRGSCRRLCREAPVPTVDLEGRDHSPGGAANTALNLACLGARVRLLGVVGDDQEGEALAESLRRAGVDVSGVVVEPGRRTVAKHRLLAGGQMLARFDQGSVHPPKAPSVRRLAEGLSSRANAVVVSDYGLGLLVPSLIARLADLSRGLGERVVAVDSRDLAAYRGVSPSLVKPNYDEALDLIGFRHMKGPSRAEGIALHEDRLLQATGAQVVAVTLDQEGAVVFEAGRPSYRTYARPSSQPGVAGAGDTFLSAFTLALVAGAGTQAAAEVASAAAGIAVEKDGTEACSALELREVLQEDRKHLRTPERLSTCVELHRERGKRVVFTNGCFDILHPGHVSCLNRAKDLGDVLIVGVNSDDSVRRLKGPSRPINPLRDRMQVLGALSCVDHVVAFDGDSPVDLIGIIRPDVYAKGGDYTHSTLPEAALVESLGGEVALVPYLEETSTTGIIQRISVVSGRADVRGLGGGPGGGSEPEPAPKGPNFHPALAPPQPSAGSRSSQTSPAQ